MDCYRVIGGLKNGILPSLQTCHHNSVVAVVVLLPTVQKEGGEYYYNTQQMRYTIARVNFKRGNIFFILLDDINNTER